MIFHTHGNQSDKDSTVSIMIPLH